MRPARNALRPASTASRIASAMRIGSRAPAIAVVINTPSQPISIATAASDAENPVQRTGRGGVEFFLNAPREKRLTPGVDAEPHRFRHEARLHAPPATGVP